MSRKVVVEPQAEQDLLNAMQWYSSQHQGLELNLLAEVSQVIEEIAAMPEYFQIQYRNVRIRYTSKFKYGIHYTIDGSTIYVHAILHTSRLPRT